jgi:hypothetical protein
MEVAAFPPQGVWRRRTQLNTGRLRRAEVGQNQRNDRVVAPFTDSANRLLSEFVAGLN